MIKGKGKFVAKNISHYGLFKQSHLVVVTAGESQLFIYPLSLKKSDV